MEQQMMTDAGTIEATPAIDYTHTLKEIQRTRRGTDDYLAGMTYDRIMAAITERMGNSEQDYLPLAFLSNDYHTLFVKVDPLVFPSEQQFITRLMELGFRIRVIPACKAKDWFHAVDLRTPEEIAAQERRDKRTKSFIYDHKTEWFARLRDWWNK
jgi:hypothetical protein